MEHYNTPFEHFSCAKVTFCKGYMKIKSIRKSDDDSLAITKKKKGGKIIYLDEQGKKITNKKLLARINSLVIPPMWTDVQICKWEDGHIQATGRDLKGRKQYIYHSLFAKKQQEKKFRKMKRFGKKLPEIRKMILKDIDKKDWKRPKILALLISLLDETGIRIGNQQYAQKNDTYGLTTLRRKHLEVNGKSLKFEYKGKSNKMREVEIDDPDLIKLVKKSAQLPGYELFRYKDHEGRFRNIDSDDVNNYIHIYMGKRFSSKDFRTWVASRMAVELYPAALERKKEAPRKKFGNILIRMVADELGNTPSICRDYYVHPKIMRRIEKQNLPDIKKFKDDKKEYGYSASEKLLLKLL
ncbi:DNA topoisomerase IB [Portibacter marinus]|uniref:DNA topoisomerase IB n=1 Tax=Portibacter marinus TaxID=2898660 RepID=UPI001F343666|nr:hypothetical protein [Portibacter marinus]